MRDFELFKALCDLWSTHFSILLACVTILSGLFGIGCPLLFSFFQRKNMSGMTSRFKREVYELTEETARQRKELHELKEQLWNAYVVLAQFYLDKASLYLRDYSNASNDAARAQAIASEISSLGNMFKCLINAQNQREVIKMMDSAVRFADVLNMNAGILEEVQKILWEESPDGEFFISKSQLAEIVSVEHPTYKTFLSKFKPIFDIAHA